jgi:hypothetical protein
LRPWLSLVLAEAPVNKETETLVNVMEIEAVSCDFHCVVRLRVRSMSEV